MRGDGSSVSKSLRRIPCMARVRRGTCTPDFAARTKSFRFLRTETTSWPPEPGSVSALRGEPFPATRPSVLQHAAAADRLHTRPETVPALANKHARLKGTFHCV